MTVDERCPNPSCREEGSKVPELSDRLRACLSINCRVNSFEVEL